MRSSSALLLAMLVALPLHAAAAASASHDAPPLPPFRLSVEVDAPDARRTIATLGVDERATPGYDVGLDEPAPPPPPGGAWAQAYFVDVGEHLRRDLVSGSPNASWSLAVDVAGAAGDITLRWDADDLAAFPSTLALNATVDGRTFDIRDEPTLTVTKDEGTATVRVIIAVEPMWGSAPDAPGALAATPTPWSGDVRLSWSPPASDGGHPIRGFIVYRATDGGAPVVIGGTRGNATTFTDPARPLGARDTYAVSAVNRIGEGNASAGATSLGLGKPAFLLANDPGPGERDERVLRADAPLPMVSARAPPMHLALLSVQAGPSVEDGAQYRFRVTVLGESHEATVFTLVEVPVPLDERVGDTPEASVATPAGQAGATLDARVGEDGRPSALVVGTDADAGDASWHDRSLLP